MTDSLRSQMPDLYRRWLPDLFDRPAIAEPRATCSNCAMCGERDKQVEGAVDAEASSSGFFRPDIKCCSYHPTLPNYLVGDALRDTSLSGEVGRARLRAKIHARIGVTMSWLAAPRKYLVLYDAARESSFGRSDDLLCPYFERETGGCTVWPFRESVCATFFCKHGSGATGQAFWQALKRYLAHVEVALSRYAATSIRGVAPPAELPRMKLTRDDLEGRAPGEADYARLWGDWVGREEAFYVECAKLVAELGKDELARVIDDAGGRELYAELTARHEALTNPRLAPRLVMNKDLRRVPAPGGMKVTTYSSYDPLFLTQDLYDTLALFSADELTVDGLARLARDHDVELPEALLLDMQLHGVMTPVTEPAAPAADAST